MLDHVRRHKRLTLFIVRGETLRNIFLHELEVSKAQRTGYLTSKNPG
jgi:hypothetical protein